MNYVSLNIVELIKATSAKVRVGTGLHGKLSSPLCIIKYPKQ